MLKDNADIAVTRTLDGWRFTLKSRSALEHRRLVRIAQVLGASISQQKPWALLAYDELRSPSDSPSKAENWPMKVQISGVTADPGRHARVFVPKTIALLGYFVAFAFACRSMIRDISNNTLPIIIAALNGRWLCLIAAKICIAVMMGLIVLWSLLLFAATYQDFQIKDGLYLITVVQFNGLLVSAMLGIAFSLLARTESRIYFIGSAYLVLLVLLSGLIAKIDQKEQFLSFISSVFPLGYAMDILSDWMFFGVVPAVGDDRIQIMSALLIVSIVVVCGSVLSFKRTI
jgi:hypothetical protein